MHLQAAAINEPFWVAGFSCQLFRPEKRVGNLSLLHMNDHGDICHSQAQFHPWVNYGLTCVD